MNSFERLDELVDFIMVNNLPHKNLVWVSKQEKIEFDNFVKSLHSNSVPLMTLPNTKINCDTVEYRGHTFYIITYNS